MPLNAVTATANPDQCRLNKRNAIALTVQVGNNTVAYQLNVAQFGSGENWVPIGGANLVPGLWHFDQTDWNEYGVEVIQGIRFTSVNVASPGVVSVS